MAPPPPAEPPAPAPVDEGDGADLFLGRARRSAAADLAVLAAPPAPALPAAPSGPPMVPAALRSEGLDDTADGEDDQGSPRLGALSLSAILAIALAALRGTVTVVTDWRQRRQERAAEEAVWREARIKRLAAEEDARARLAKVPTSAEFGRKAIQDGRKGAGLSPVSGKGGRTGGATGGSGAGGSGRKTGPDPSRPKTGPSKTSGPDASKSGGSGKPGPGPKKTGPDKPGKPSAGVLAPGKGKPGGSGGTGKGSLDRIRDRKTPGPTGGSSSPGKAGGPGAGKSGTGPKGKANGPSSGPAGAKGSGGGAIGPNRKGLGNGPSAAAAGKKTGPGRGGGPTGSGKTGPGTGAGPAAGTRPEPGKTGRGRGRKVPGIKHGTHEGYDVHGCRCRRCRRMANGRRKPRPNPPGSTSGRGTPPPGGAGTPPPPRRGRRRSSDDDLRSATAWTETVITVERVDRPGDAERRTAPAAPAAVTTGTRGLPRAPHKPAGNRPGTTAPTVKEPPMTVPAQATRSAARTPAGVAPEHLTEVTLDDVLDHLAGSKGRCFATYDACAVLADHARKLRREFDELAADLAEHHNIVGTLTATASDHFAELMAVLAHKAEEMRTESLTAAEKVETAHDAMHDAYRPVQEATADAGLVMPSARAHNED